LFVGAGASRTTTPRSVTAGWPAGQPPIASFAFLIASLNAAFGS
jgi:hypothetical protein